MENVLVGVGECRFGECGVVWVKIRLCCGSVLPVLSIPCWRLPPFRFFLLGDVLLWRGRGGGGKGRAGAAPCCFVYGCHGIVLGSMVGYCIVVWGVERLHTYTWGLFVL